MMASAIHSAPTPIEGRLTMRIPGLVGTSLAALALIAALPLMQAHSESAVKIDPPTVDAAPAEGLQTAVIAGGCFWGIQAVYQHTKGVTKAISGYAGGDKKDANYEIVGSGRTGHAEAVQITYDPRVISYGKILQIFFSVAHNPTQLNYQGPDHGPQYRSAVFTLNDEQKKVAEAYVAQLDKAGVYPEKIVTEVTPASAFFAAEDYHQDYLTLHPSQPYIAYNDIPKVENLRAMFPDVWQDKPKLVFANNAS